MTMRWRSPSGAQTAEPNNGSNSALNTSANAALEGKGKENDHKQQQHASSPFGAGESQSAAASSSAGPILDDEPDTAMSSSSQRIEEEEIKTNPSKNIPQTASTSTPDTVLVSAADPSSGDPPYEEGSDSAAGKNKSNKSKESSPQSKDASTNRSTASSSSSSSTVDEDESDQEVPWRPQATQSTCEFTHTITNYSQKRDSGCKKAEYSATTIDEFGNRWRLIVYVNGNGRASNHHLSLFLQVADADDLPFGWKKAVSYVLTLEHPSGPNLSYAKRNPDKTFKLCPKAIDWGWSQFITSDRIQQEGFVQSDSLVVRASVTVKSSSVCIDLEDAELYLKCAVEEGKPEAVQLCLEQGASVNCQFKDDLYTPLHTACSSSTAEDVAAAAAAIAADDSPPSSNGSNNHNNPGSMKVLNLLLEKGADGNACNKWRETPLLIAANNGHRQAVEALLKHGADPSLCSEAGWSALTFAAHKGYDDIVALLLRAGAPVNCRVTEDSSTPLHKACAGSKPGHLNAVKLLLEHEADVHALNKWRETPLLTAANHGQAGAVEALLSSGADPCKCTDTGWSPLSIAAYKGHDDVVRLLLEEGAPTEEADPTLSALLQAATKGLPGTVELLLKHGADHTVTTKKGDTALSILVEQNLIDAAVEMVTSYKASVPRCSRDRKKVQRARLLINLRVKQQQKEGKFIVSDDDETDEESETAKAQHSVDKNNGNAKKKKMTAEEQAKLAEEALLFELEQEDAKRNKEVHEANKKSAKKRKKKERERQVKKEQEEKRMAEEKERQRKQKEEKEAKERAEKKRREEEEKKRQQEYREQQKKEQQQREKQRKEQQQREQQQKEKEQQRLKAQEQQQLQNTAKNASPPAVEKRGKQVKAKAVNKRQPVGLAPVPPPAPAPASAINKQETAHKPVGKNATPSKTATKPAVQSTTRQAPPPGKNRGWETKQPIVPDRKKSSPKATSSSSSDLSSKDPTVIPTSSSGSPGLSTPSRAEKPVNSAEFFPQPQPANSSSPFSNQQAVGEVSSMLNPKPAPAPQQSYISSDSLIINGLATARFPQVEVPAVALFRRDKVTELIQRCSVGRNSNDPLSVVSEATIRKVLYRWMVRAAHESSPSVDCIIPSWHDFEQLTTFFHRQFISESRKGVNQSAPGSSVLSMESLKEAGSAMAHLCHSLAKDIADFCRRVDEQLQKDWVDTSIAMNASIQNGATSVVYLTWANRSQVSLPALTFTKLRERYTGPQSRILSAIFSAKIRQETKQLLVNSRSMDICLPPDTQSVLSMKASVSAEVWSNPFSTPSGNMFWGQFSDVDTLFGGLAPFSKESGGEDLLIRHGGSVSVVPPMDNMVASRYVHRMVDILDQTARDRVAVSFAIFFRAECFLDWNNAPSINDLFMLDPRLRDRSSYVSKVEQLAAGQHSFFNEKTAKLETSSTGSLFVVLQNEGGRSHYGMKDAVVAEIIRTMGGNVPRAQEPKLLTPMSFSAPEFVPSQEPQRSISMGYFDAQPPPQPVSPIRQHSLSTDFGQQPPQQKQQPLEFGTIGGTAISNAFSVAPAPGGGRRARGRLFDLVDDGEEDQLNDDVVSGMLGNLNVDLFQNTNGGDQVVDIEAISLMGIGGPPPAGGLQPRNSQGRFG